jgi:hypothetical protein
MKRILEQLMRGLATRKFLNEMSMTITKGMYVGMMTYYITTRNFGFCNSRMQLKFSCM